CSAGAPPAWVWGTGGRRERGQPIETVTVGGRWLDDDLACRPVDCDLGTRTGGPDGRQQPGGGGRGREPIGPRQDGGVGGRRGALEGDAEDEVPRERGRE